MKKILATWTAAIAVLASAGALAAHHSLANFNTETPIRVKGTVVAFERVNPHSIIFLDQKSEDGQVQRWAVDGPGATQLDRMSVAKDVLKTGDVIEVCGFTLKAAPNLQARVMNGHVLVMPDGKKRFWSNYGLLDKCLGPGESDSLIR